MNPLSRAFSASCLSVDDYDYTMPRGKPVKHVLGSGEDLFDENGRPYQPQPKTMTKIFSGSTLDLDNTDPSDSDSHQVSPAAAPHDRTQQSFNDYLDQRQRTRHDLGASAQSKTMVLVVGGAGYLASHIIEQLLREGYEVRATLPDMRDSPKLRDLCSMVPESKHMLSVVEANIINSASMRSAMLGCRYVIHCGVPQLPQGADAVEYHRQAVLALFDAARETGGARVERIVLTGSHTNVLSSTKSRAPTESGLYDETQWNGIATRTSDPLSFARVSFEKEAVRLRDIQAGSFELTVVLPAIMIGPTRTQEVSEAMRNIMEFSTASPHFPIAPNVYWNFVDVRDVATAHVKAMTSPNANGQRYIVTHTVLNLAGLGRQIRAHFPHLTPPVYTAPFLLSIVAGPWLSRASLRYLWSTLGVRRVLDGRRACNELDLTMTPMADTIRDAIDSLIEQGHLPPNDGTVATSGAVVMARYAAGFSVLVAGVSAAFIVLRRRSQ